MLIQTVDTANHLILIESYQLGQVRIRQNWLATPLLIIPGQLPKTLSPHDFSDLLLDTVSFLHAGSAELLLIGTGAKQQFASDHQYAILAELPFGFELMSSAAACRTYNLLIADGREVAVLVY